MDRRPIGVFDSGLGGLTAVRELTKLMPEEDLIYFGDTGRVPYGGRSQNILVKYARQDVNFLRSYDPKIIVIACGTVSTIALDVLQEENPMPVIGVVGPAVRAAAACSASGRVGLIGTQTTVRSQVYERELKKLRPDARILARACPLYVPLVENGRYRPGDPVVEILTEEYLTPFREEQVDTLILGCTHYPLLKEVIGKFMGSEVTLIDVGEQCARWVADLLLSRGLQTEDGTQGLRRYFVSDSTEDFAGLASTFLGESVFDEVEKIDITMY